MGRLTLPGPGGDVIGGRPLDTNVQGLQALGVEIELDRYGTFQMQTAGLKGAGYLLQSQASVTATENTLMAAVMADGETTIDNAAREPHTQDLCHFLNQLGANIEGVGSGRLVIQGVKSLSGGEFTIGSDYMEVGSFIGAAAVTGGEIRIRRAGPNNLGLIGHVYRQLGVHWEVDGEDIVVPASQPMEIVPAFGGRIPEIKPHPWPGFPPDLMSIAVVLACQATGSVLLHDWMYESRFFFVDKLVFMGARIVLCDPHRVIVQGPNVLYANPQGVTSPDIRAGMAMLLAALCARGTSKIDNIQQIDRGYEQIEAKLITLGARIERVNE
jgi:UDP-N-acetylglucosamine 1-carboxyvinyltransferase